MDYKTLVDFDLRNKVMVRYLFNLDERAKNNLITLMKEKEVIE